MNAPTLFDVDPGEPFVTVRLPNTVGQVRPSDPDTSHYAAALPRQSLAAAVRACLADHPHGLTDAELLTLLGLPERKRGSVAKRRHDCGARDTGRRRLSPDGNPMVVWALEVES